MGKTIFNLEIFIDTVDFTRRFDTQAPAHRVAMDAAMDFSFIFPGHPALLIPRPDTLSNQHAAQWITTRLNKRRLRCTYQEGVSALFEMDPLQLSKTLSAEPMLGLALSPPPERMGPGAANAPPRPPGKKTLEGTTAMTMFGYRPPDAGGWQRLGGAGSASWGCDERAVPFQDSFGRTVAVALVVVSLSAFNATLWEQGVFGLPAPGANGQGPDGAGSSEGHHGPSGSVQPPAQTRQGGPPSQQWRGGERSGSGHGAGADLLVEVGGTAAGGRLTSATSAISATTDGSLGSNTVHHNPLSKSSAVSRGMDGMSPGEARRVVHGVGPSTQQSLSPPRAGKVGAAPPGARLRDGLMESPPTTGTGQLSIDWEPFMARAGAFHGPRTRTGIGCQGGSGGAAHSDSQSLSVTPNMTPPTSASSYGGGESYGPASSESRTVVPGPAHRGTRAGKTPRGGQSASGRSLWFPEEQEPSQSESDGLSPRPFANEHASHSSPGIDSMSAASASPSSPSSQSHSQSPSSRLLAAGHKRRLEAPLHSRGVPKTLSASAQRHWYSDKGEEEIPPMRLQAVGASNDGGAMKGVGDDAGIPTPAPGTDDGSTGEGTEGAAGTGNSTAAGQQGKADPQAMAAAGVAAVLDATAQLPAGGLAGRRASTAMESGYRPYQYNPPPLFYWDGGGGADVAPPAPQGPAAESQPSALRSSGEERRERRGDPATADAIAAIEAKLSAIDDKLSAVTMQRSLEVSLAQGLGATATAAEDGAGTANGADASTTVAGQGGAAGALGPGILRRVMREVTALEQANAAVRASQATAAAGGAGAGGADATNGVSTSSGPDGAGGTSVLGQLFVELAMLQQTVQQTGLGTAAGKAAAVQAAGGREFLSLRNRTSTYNPRAGARYERSSQTGGSRMSRLDVSLGSTAPPPPEHSPEAEAKLEAFFRERMQDAETKTVALSDLQPFLEDTANGFEPGIVEAMKNLNPEVDEAKVRISWAAARDLLQLQSDLRADRAFTEGNADAEGGDGDTKGEN